MTLKGGLIGVLVVAVVLYLADWAFYMVLMPTPADLRAAMGSLMYTEANMPNPGWYFLMEICAAGLLAFACLQTTLTSMQAAQRGALVFMMVAGLMDVNWGMTLNVAFPVSMVFTELAYKAVMGGIGGVVMVMVAKRFS
ncbi:MAG: hypothetical protein NTX15_00075 [Candidatus Kapabacteria bacterium]|nr:hypothetical protein [Candidatus Kapabacteria bacterium]